LVVESFKAHISHVMKLLAVHPSCLMYSKIYLRLEPLGLELVAAAAQREGHSVQIIDLQSETQRVLSMKHLGFAALRETQD
jgi:hypothetical protein